jgi:hypothetical protein
LLICKPIAWYRLNRHKTYNGPSQRMTLILQSIGITMEAAIIVANTA